MFAAGNAIKTRPKPERKTVVAQQFEDRKSFSRNGSEKKENRYSSWKAPKDTVVGETRTIQHPSEEKMSCAGASDMGLSGRKNLMVRRGGDDDESGWYCRGPRSTNALSLRQKYLQWKRTTPRREGTPAAGTTVKKASGAPVRDKNNKIIKRKTRTLTFYDYLRENPGATRAFGPANQ